MKRLTRFKVYWCIFILFGVINLLLGIFSFFDLDNWGAGGYKSREAMVILSSIIMVVGILLALSGMFLYKRTKRGLVGFYTRKGIVPQGRDLIIQEFITLFFIIFMAWELLLLIKN